MNPRRSLGDAPFAHAGSDGRRLREVRECCKVLTSLGDTLRCNQLARGVDLTINNSVEHGFLDIKLADHVAHRVIMSTAIVTGSEHSSSLG